MLGFLLQFYFNASIELEGWQFVLEVEVMNEFVLELEGFRLHMSMNSSNSFTYVIGDTVYLAQGI